MKLIVTYDGRAMEIDPKIDSDTLEDRWAEELINGHLYTSIVRKVGPLVPGGTAEAARLWATGELRVFHRWEVADYRLQLEKQWCLPFDFGDQDYETSQEHPEQEVAASFIGTVFNLTPSGKYYQPFACSNVEQCPICRGEGRVRLLTSDPDVYRVATDADQVLREGLMDTFGSYAGGRWPKKLWATLKQLEAVRGQTAPEDRCPMCDGLGSREAAQDEDWRTAFEQLLAPHGQCLENGEGDPCDLFIVQYREKEAVDAD